MGKSILYNLKLNVILANTKFYNYFFHFRIKMVQMSLSLYIIKTVIINLLLKKKKTSNLCCFYSMNNIRSKMEKYEVKVKIFTNTSLKA